MNEFWDNTRKSSKRGNQEKEAKGGQDMKQR